MKGLIIGGVVCVIILFVSLHFLFKGLERNENRFKVYVGEKVVVGKDTLIITDYSQVREIFTLSNGIEVSYEFADKQLKK